MRKAADQFVGIEAGGDVAVDRTKPIGPGKTRVIAIGLAFILVAATSPLWYWPDQPYRFLDGKNPVRVDDRSASGDKVIDRCYAFQADFEALNQRVTKELASNGFAPVFDDHRFGPRAIEYERTGAGLRSAFVILYQDMHYKLPQHGAPYSVVA